MYRVVKILDKNGNSRDDYFADLKSRHPNMSGEILFPEYVRVDGYLCLLWNDDTNKMLRTSRIEKCEIDNGILEVITRNSAYYLEEIK